MAKASWQRSRVQRPPRSIMSLRESASRSAAPGGGGGEDSLEATRVPSGRQAEAVIWSWRASAATSADTASSDDQRSATSRAAKRAMSAKGPPCSGGRQKELTTT